MRFIYSTVMLVLFAGLAAAAADETISGKVTQVDPEKGTIVVTPSTGAAKSYDVLKKAKIEVNGKAGTLKDLGPGLAVTLTYNKDLEVITGISATGKSKPAPELLELSEIPTGGDVFSPFVTPDGMLFYSRAKKGMNNTLMIASRKSPDVLFGEGKPLFPGIDTILSSNGKELYCVDGGIKVSSRTPADNTFTRLQQVEEFKDLRGRVPSLSNKDLTMHFLSRSANKGEPPTFYRSSRANLTAKWDKPEVVKVTPQEPGYHLHFVSPDGTKLFLNRVAAPVEANILMFSLAKDGKSFEKPRVVDIGKKIVGGLYPRWVPEANELYFNTVFTQERETRIYVIRNFDPELHTKELKK